MHLLSEIFQSSAVKLTYKSGLAIDSPLDFHLKLSADEEFVGVVIGIWYSLKCLLIFMVLLLMYFILHPKMVRKKVGKQRLDKYYHLAKEHGYRARSAFKLLQLNQKFGILDKCEVLIDLCAAPGGWLQIAAKEMKNKRQIIGIDLSTIKALPEVQTLQCDITSNECLKELKSILVDEADVVLHDGAPNVGTDWEKDAYSQNELVLHSLKLAAEFLRIDGVFVTKVFRSKDYSSLLWVFNQLFASVVSTKPLSSRDESAEIFVVCKGFYKPEVLDHSFFDPVKVFGDIKQEKSASELFKGKGKDGYDDFNFFKKMSFHDFLVSTDLLKNLLKVFQVAVDSRYIDFFDSETIHILSDLRVVNLNDLKKVVRKRDRFLRLVHNASQGDNLYDLKTVITPECAVEEFDVELPGEDEDWKANHIRHEIKKRERKEKKGQKRELLRKANSNVFKLPNSKFFDDKLFKINPNEIDKKVTDVASRDEVVNKQNSEDFESEDFDIDANEIKVLGQYKDNEENFVLNTVDKHVMGDEDLPEWFLREEREFNCRLVDESSEIVDKKTRKKETEAMNRRKKKAKRRVDSLLKHNGENVDEEDEDGEGKKKSLLRNAFRKTKTKPLLVFPKNGKIMIPRTNRKIKLVDRRMKKEIRAERKRDKRRK